MTGVQTCALPISRMVANFRDDQRIGPVPGAWKVVGKKTYTTRLGGPRTIDHVEEIDLQPMLNKMVKPR